MMWAVPALLRGPAPPMSSTPTPGNSVAVCCERGVDMLPAGLNGGWLGSYVSASFTGPLLSEPPATRIAPFSCIVAVWPIRATCILWMSDVNVELVSVNTSIVSRLTDVS